MIKWLKSFFGETRAARQLHPPEAPFELVRVNGAEALSTLLTLRRTRAGQIPVAFGDRRELGNVLEIMSSSPRPYDESVHHGLELDVEGWIEQRFQEDPGYFKTDKTSSGDSQETEPLSLVRDDLTGKPKEEVFIGLIPVEQPWQVPAYLRTGGWNDCPMPEVHVAFFKRWYERYGAIVTGISTDTIEFSVQNPPSSMDEAHRLAREQFAYCADIVHQGVGTKASLAKTLLSARNWLFWWD